MNEIKDRNKILHKIKTIRQFSVKLDKLDDALRLDELNEEIKEGIEKSAWKLINELNKLTSEK